MYQFSALDFNHPERLAYVPLPILVSFLLNGITEACVQGFFSFRIYRLSRKLYIPCLVWILAVVQLLLSLLPVVEGSKENILISSFETEQTWVVYSTMGVSALNDIIIATTLVYYLYKERSDVEKRTVIVLDKLIQWTIETCVITSTAAILELICFAIMPENFTWIAVDVLLGELFTNSLLASLNSRATLRDVRTQGTTFRVNEVTLDVSSVSIPLASISSSTETCICGRQVNASLNAEVLKV